MATDSNTGKQLKPVRQPYALKRTVHRIEHGGQEYLLNDIIERMNGGLKLSLAIQQAYPNLPKPSVPALATKVKKHPYFQAYKDASLKVMQDQGAALQQNMLDLAFNSRSDMVKFSATKDAMDRVYGEADSGEAEKPVMVFNFAFGDNAPKKHTTIIEGEVVE